MNDDIFLEDHLYQLPSITLPQINIDDIGVEGGEIEQFTQPIYAGHNENLANILPNYVLDKIAAQLMDDIESDFLSRKDWEEGLVKGLKQLGLKSDSKNFPFQGSAGVYSPVMIRTIVEFFSSSVPELLPLEGPVKQIIVGNRTDELEEQADRVETWSNFYFTEEAPEFYSDFKKMLMWLPWVGSTIRKTYFDPLLKRPTSSFIKPQDFVVKYGTTSLDTCWRMTERVYLNEMEISYKQQIGEYREISLPSDDDGDNTSNFKKAQDEVEGMTEPNYNNDDDFTLYECHTYLSLEELEENEASGDDKDSDKPYSKTFKPYIVTIHVKTQKILAIYRNWEEGDKDFRRQDIYTNFCFIEGLGFYGFGAAHLIGGLSEASTSLLRQTIDGQTLSNFPGGLRVKGMKAVDNNLRIGPTEFHEIDTGGLPIQQAIMMMPYKEPSPHINVLRNELETSASGIMGAANMQIADFNPNIPVGTTYALLGLLFKVQSTILRGIRDSMSKEFKKFYKLFAKHLPDSAYTYNREGGESQISRFDFSEEISMVPVADPHITTETQRLIRNQTLLETAKADPQLHNLYEVHKMFYKAMKLTDAQIDEIMPPPQQVMSLNPISENQNLMQGKPAKAALTDDHPSHMTVHGLMTTDPSTPPEIMAAVMAHIAEHKSFEFMIQMEQMTGIQMPADPTQLPVEAQNQIAMAAAQAIMQQQQQAQEQAPPPPIDPAAVMLEDVKTKKEIADLKAQVESFKAQLDYEAKMKELELDERKVDIDERELELKQGVII